MGSHRRGGSKHRVVANLANNEFWTVLDISGDRVQQVDELVGFDDGENQAVSLAVDYLLRMPGASVEPHHRPIAHAWFELHGHRAAARVRRNLEAA